MKRKKIGMLLIALMIAAGVLVSEVMAQINGPCPPYPGSCNFSSTLSLDLQVAQDANACPIDPTVFDPANGANFGWVLPPGVTRPTTGCYKWTYTFRNPTGDYRQMNQIVGLLPKCCNVSYYVPSQCMTLYPPGAGDPTTKFGAGDYQSYVMRFTPNATSCASFYVITDKLPPARHMSFQLKSGSSLLGCTDIAGPNCLEQCPVAGFVPRNVSECKILDGIPVRIERNITTWCIDKVFKCTDQKCTNCAEEVFPITPPIIEGKQGISCGTTDGNQHCQECIIFSASSPGCTSIWSGGSYRAICW